MSRPKSKRKLRRFQLKRARKRYEERKKQRIAELRTQSVSNAVDTAPRRLAVKTKPA